MLILLNFWPRGRKFKARKLDEAEIRGRLKLKGMRQLRFGILVRDFSPKFFEFKSSTAVQLSTI